jgi:hypothetical protein
MSIPDQGNAFGESNTARTHILCKWTSLVLDSPNLMRVSLDRIRSCTSYLLLCRFRAGVQIFRDGVTDVLSWPGLKKTRFIDQFGSLSGTCGANKLSNLEIGILSVRESYRCGEIPGRLALCIADSTIFML